VQKLSLGNNLITARLTAQPPPSGTEQRWDQLLVLFVSDSSSSFSSSETKYNPIQRSSSKLPNPKDTISFRWWLVLVCSERKVLLADCWWLVCCESKVLLAGGCCKLLGFQT
jgi:hypothetical protein